MKYITINTIKNFTNNESLYNSMLLDYAKSVNEYDFVMSLQNYLELITNVFTVQYITITSGRNEKKYAILFNRWYYFYSHIR